MPLYVNRRYWLMSTLVALMGVLGVLGYGVMSRQGVPERVWNAKAQLTDFVATDLNAERNQYGRLIKNFMYDCDFYNFSEFANTVKGIHPSLGVPNYCYARGKAGDQIIFLWGDSHAQMLHYGLTQNLFSPYRLVQVARAGCKPGIDLKNVAEKDPICAKEKQFALQEIAALRPFVVILAQRDLWDSKVAQELQSRLISLGAQNILFVGKSPEWKANLTKIVARKYWFNLPSRSLSDIDLAGLNEERRSKTLINALPNAQYLDLLNLFCNPQEGCMVYVGEGSDKRLISYDTNHLSPAASDYAAKHLLIPVIESISINQR